ncbi:hypothetical protein YC2023_073246 [Brassica napus]
MGDPIRVLNISKISYSILFFYACCGEIESEDIWSRRIERDGEVRNIHEKGKGQMRELESKFDVTLSTLHQIWWDDVIFGHTELKSTDETEEELKQSVDELEAAEETEVRVDELSELSDTTLELDELSDTTLELSELSDTENGDGLAAGRNGPYSVQGKVHKKVQYGFVSCQIRPALSSVYFKLILIKKYLNRVNKKVMVIGCIDFFKVKSKFNISFSPTKHSLFRWTCASYQATFRNPSFVGLVRHIKQQLKSCSIKRLSAPLVSPFNPPMVEEKSCWLRRNLVLEWLIRISKFNSLIFLSCVHLLFAWRFHWVKMFEVDQRRLFSQFEGREFCDNLVEGVVKALKDVSKIQKKSTTTRAPVAEPSLFISEKPKVKSENNLEDLKKKLDSLPIFDEYDEDLIESLIICEDECDLPSLKSDFMFDEEETNGLTCFEPENPSNLVLFLHDFEEEPFDY